MLIFTVMTGTRNDLSQIARKLVKLPLLVKYMKNIDI